MPLQARATLYIFSQQDMIIQSRTGSCKTDAYLLPILEMVNLLQNVSRVLIFARTRELVLQSLPMLNCLVETTM